MYGACNVKLFLPRPLGPWGGAKRSNIIQFQLQSQFQRFFIPNFVCVLTNERYKTYQMGFSFCGLGHAPGVGLAWGFIGGLVPDAYLWLDPPWLTLRFSLALIICES